MSGQRLRSSSWLKNRKLLIFRRMKDQKQEPEVPLDSAPENKLSLRQRVDRSLLISLVAVAISLIGTVVSVYEAGVLSDQQKLQAEQKSASAWPYVAIDRDVSSVSDSIATLKFTAVNLGVGPAILGDVNYLYRGQGYESYNIDNAIREDLTDLNQKDGKNFQVYSTQNWQIDSLVLPPEKDVSIVTLRIVGGKDYVSMDVANSIANQVSIQFCYCSVYGDCWYRGKSIAPEKNPDCSSYINY